MTTSYVLKRFNLAKNYLEMISKAGYQLIDLDMVEPFDAEDQLDLSQNIVFEKENQLYAIRSDWTRSISNYQQTFELNQSNFGYFGAVVRNYSSSYQAGVELINPTVEQMVASIQLHSDFVENVTKAQFNIFVVNHEAILDMYIKKFDLSPAIKTYVIEKNLSAIRNILGEDHDFYKLMTCPVSHQFDLVKSDFGDSQAMAPILLLKELLAASNSKLILDISFRSPRKYYNGFYFQAFLNGQSTPIISGGQYASNWFGIGMNVQKGGII